LMKWCEMACIRPSWWLRYWQPVAQVVHSNVHHICWPTASGKWQHLLDILSPLNHLNPFWEPLKLRVKTFKTLFKDLTGLWNLRTLGHLDGLETLWDLEVLHSLALWYF
jgi:hypothetical protein